MRNLFVLSLLALSVVSSAEDNGLLLGLSDREGNSHTVWIGQQGVATFARQAGDGYWLWKDKGFMHIVPVIGIQPAGQTVTGTNRVGGWAVAVTDVNGTVREIKSEEGRPLMDFHVMYVAPRGIGLMRNMNPIISQPSAFGEPPKKRSTFPISYRHHDWADLQTAVEIEQVFDEQLIAAFNTSARNMASGISFQGRRLDPEASPSNWTLRRSKGSWSLNGLLYTMFDANSPTYHQEFPVAGLDDLSLGAKYIKGPSWSRIVSEYPDVIDYTTSPDGKLTVIVTPTDVFVHKSSGSSLQKRLQRVRVAADRIVMTQWIGDSEVRKVATAVTKIKR